MSKTLIQNAKVYDGTGNKAFLADVLIDGERIGRIGAIPPEEGWEVVDAKGKALSPGFINTHSHMELEIIKHPSLDSVIQQGITTEILGQDGSSVAPLTDSLVQELADNMAPLAGTLDTPYPWRSFGDYMRIAADHKPAARFEVRIQTLHRFRSHAAQLKVSLILSFQRKRRKIEHRVCTSYMFQCFELFDGFVRNIFIRRFLFTHTAAVAVHHTVTGFSRDSEPCRAAVKFHLFIHRLLQSQTEGDHDDDGRRPDHHAEDRQECPQFPPLKAACAHPQ